MLTRRTMLDLSGSRQFAAGGFAGSVDSTVMLQTGPPGFGPPLDTSKPGHHAATVHEVTVTYRVTRSVGDVLVRWHAAGGGTCRRLGLCGADGTVQIASRPARGDRIAIEAEAPARRPYRDLLAALGLSERGNSRGILLSGGGGLSGPGSVTSHVTRRNTRCADTTRLVSSPIDIQERGSRVTATCAPTSRAFDVVRTRCPGPTLGDHPAATASISSLTSGDATPELQFDRPQTLRGPGFTVWVEPHLSLMLARTGVGRRASS